MADQPVPCDMYSPPTSSYMVVNHPREHLDWDRQVPDTPALPRLRRRRADDVRAVLHTPPKPVVCVEEYVLNPCAVHPEIVTEFPVSYELPDRLRRKIDSWAEQNGLDATYHQDIARAPGWKAMGYGFNWGTSDPYPIHCDCGEQQLPLFTPPTENSKVIPTAGARSRTSLSIRMIRSESRSAAATDSKSVIARRRKPIPSETRFSDWVGRT